MRAPEIMQELKRDALHWVNNVRMRKLHMAPLDELPKGQPGNGHNCVIARCWQMQDEKQLRERHFHGAPMIRMHRVDVCSAASRLLFVWARYPSDPPREEYLTLEHPREVAMFIKHFDSGDYPELIDPMLNRALPAKMDGKPVTATMVQQAYKDYVQRLQAQMPPPPMVHIDFGSTPPFAFETPEAPVKAPTEEPELA